MGYYINIGNAAFQSVRNGEYVDKSGLIAVVNNTLFRSAGTVVSSTRHTARTIPPSLRDDAGRMLLVGISYDRDTKQHSCRIEELTK